MSLPWRSQTEIVRTLLTSAEACRELHGVLKGEHFQNPALGRVADIAIRLGADQGVPATEGQVQAALASDEELVQSSALSALAESMNAQAPPVPWAVESGRHMAAWAELSRLSAEAPAYGEKMAFDAFSEEARRIAAIATGAGNSTTGLGDVEGRHSPSRILGIKTGVHRLDLCLGGGGWLPGQLILILGPDGGGKTHATVSFGTAALQAGAKVHHTTLEVEERELRGRYDRAIARVGSDQFFVRLPEVKEKIDEAEKRLTILEAVDRPMGVAALEAEILRLGPDAKPDLLIVDSGYLLSTGHDYQGEGAAQAQRNDLSALHQRLRIVGQRLRCPVITPFQCNREGLKKMYGSRQGEERDVITRGDMADALSVSRHADIVLSLNQNFHEYAAKTGRLWLDKARGGIQFQEIGCKFNWSMSLITDVTEG